MYRERNRAELEEILSPYSESLCTVYSLKIILKFFSLFSKYAKTGLDWRKFSARDLKSFICLVYQKVNSEGVVLSVLRTKGAEVLMNPLTETALTINCSQPKLDKFKEVIKCDFSQQ